jgi:hypothetical protein
MSVVMKLGEGGAMIGVVRIAWWKLGAILAAELLRRTWVRCHQFARRWWPRWDARRRRDGQAGGERTR